MLPCSQAGLCLQRNKYAWNKVGDVNCTPQAECLSSICGRTMLPAWSYDMLFMCLLRLQHPDCMCR